MAATGQGNSEPASQDLELPTALVPVFTPRIAIPNVLGATDTDVTDSFALSTRQSNSGIAAAFTVNIVRLQRGIWDLEISLQAWSNYTIVASGDLGPQVQLIDPGGVGAVTIIEAIPTANVSFSHARRFVFPVDRDEWIVRLSMPATLAGQISVGHVSILGWRLL